MGHFSSMFNGLARSLSLKKGRENSGNGNYNGTEAAEAMAKGAKKNDFILRSSGTVNVDGSKNLASVFSKRGEKGVNQDCVIVWEVFFLPQLANLWFFSHKSSSLFNISSWQCLLILAHGRNLDAKKT